MGFFFCLTDIELLSCQACRDRKIKCSGNQPCRYCTRRNIPCLFRETVKKKLYPTAYVEQLEEQVANLRRAGLPTQPSFASLTHRSPVQTVLDSAESPKSDSPMANSSQPIQSEAILVPELLPSSAEFFDSLSNREEQNTESSEPVKNSKAYFLFFR